MNREEVMSRIEYIRTRRPSESIPEDMENALRRELLQAIAQGNCDDPVGCAKAVTLLDD
jgi:hypothetical protein